MENQFLTFLMWHVKVAWWIVSLPIKGAIHLPKLLWRGRGAWYLSTHDSLPCRGCGNPLSLVGRFQCAVCSYTFDGFIARPCPNCKATPPYFECQTCGVGSRNPLYTQR